MSSRETAKGIVLINKPRGLTSFGVVSRMRKLTGIRKIGHCGTLDPFAEGLLPVCIGRATSAIQFMDGYDKTYLVKINFGRATDTMDTEGSTIDEYNFTQSELNELAANDFIMLRQAVQNMIGSSQQTPPMYSAVKLDGKPLYSYAREGKTVERKSRKINIYDAQLINIDLDVEKLSLAVDLRISCSKGTYIRVIADELGRSLGYFAYAAELVREKCGPYLLDQAFDIEELFAWSRELSDQSKFIQLISKREIHMTMSSTFVDVPRLELEQTEAISLIQGKTLMISDLADKSAVNYTSELLVLYYADELIAAARITIDEYNRKQLKKERVFVDLEDFRSI